MSNTRGFTLIISVLVLSTVLILIGTVAAFGLTRYQKRDVGVETNIDAQLLAEGCMEAALYELRLDAAYAGNEVLAIGSGTCTIRPIAAGASTTIETEATVDGYPYRLRVEVSDTANVTIASWEHVANF